MFDRVFPGDRLGPAGLLDECRDNTIAIVRAGDELVATFNYAIVRPILKFYLLAVTPKLQGEGLGRQLLDIANDVAQRERCDAIELQAVEGGRLVPYYISLGFREVTRTTMPVGYWDANEPFELITMRKATA